MVRVLTTGFIFSLLIGCNLNFAQKNDDPQQSAETIKTVLDREKCKPGEKDPDRVIDYTIICGGPGGYRIIYGSGLLYDKFSLVTPPGEIIKLDLWAKIKDPSHRGVSRYLKWRIFREQDKTTPTVLIVGAGADQGSLHTPTSRRSYTVIIKLTKKENCITDFIDKRQKNSGEKTRRAAETATNKPCLPTRKIKVKA